ncbi:hypothetical protein FQA39_LY05179 [Lamprigera yunnana]|nr:hypothetical protein FQA39_LY05179 [Lamprigera yunnana]
MFAKFSIFCVLISVVICLGPTYFHPEEECNKAGGKCIKKDECSNTIPKEYLNLCPQQQAQGAECCHGDSIKENRCQQLGGNCQPECPEFLRRPQATDCSFTHLCCVLI